jgi:hypothetical protein
MPVQGNSKLSFAAPLLIPKAPYSVINSLAKIGVLKAGEARVMLYFLTQLLTSSWKGKADMRFQMAAIYRCKITGKIVECRYQIVLPWWMSKKSRNAKLQISLYKQALDLIDWDGPHWSPLFLYIDRFKWSHSKPESISPEQWFTRLKSIHEHSAYYLGWVTGKNPTLNLSTRDIRKEGEWKAFQAGKADGEVKP